MSSIFSPQIQEQLSINELPLIAGHSLFFATYILLFFFLLFFIFDIYCDRVSKCEGVLNLNLIAATVDINISIQDQVVHLPECFLCNILHRTQGILLVNLMRLTFQELAINHVIPNLASRGSCWRCISPIQLYSELRAQLALMLPKGLSVSTSKLTWAWGTYFSATCIQSIQCLDKPGPTKRNPKHQEKQSINTRSALLVEYWQRVVL